MTDTISFFGPANSISLRDLAEKTDCEFNSNQVSGDLLISAAGPVEAAEPGSLTFIDNPKYVAALGKTVAAAVICSPRYVDKVPEGIATLVSPKPYRAFALAMGLLFSSAMRPRPVIAPGIAAGAFIDPSARLEDNVTVEHGAVVGPGACIGQDSLIGPGAIIGPQVQIGRKSSVCGGASVQNALIGNDVIIHSGVRIGNDGFGFAMGPGGHQKIPQIGRVIIQDKVEIGANSCIDRGSNRDTIIGEGTKIDNLVMVAHNVVIGQHCVIVGQTGIAGSAELGDYVVLGGKTAVNGHLKIGSGAQIAGLSGVSGDVPPGVTWGGVPARPIKHWMRDIARSRREAFAMQNRTKKDSNENG